MKKTFILIICTLFLNTLSGSVDLSDVSKEDNTQDLIGAWESVETTDQDVKMTTVMVITDGYLSIAAYSLDSREFVGTSGGAWKSVNNTIEITIEYDTDEPGNVGQIRSLPYRIENDKLFLGADVEPWKRIDHGTPGALAGPWLITGRKRDGEINKRIPGARKTMKILSGTRFQWIAYNTDTGDFFGTGGGTYTTQNGKYIENIEFFSRDGSRVGASLDFEYELDLELGDWHHSGLSSKGAPIYEIWTLRSVLDK